TGMASATATTTRWHLKGQGYELCNATSVAAVTSAGFPTQRTGVAGPLSASTSFREKVAFVVDPATNDKQVEALGQIFTGKLGGMPWEILGPTAAVVGLVKATITIEGKGRKSTFRAEGVGEGRGDTCKNPVTGEDRLADVHPT